MNPTAIIAILVFLGLSTSIMFLIFWALLRGSKKQTTDMDQLRDAVARLTRQPLSADHISKSVYTHHNTEITLAITPKSKHSEFSFFAYIPDQAPKHTEGVPVERVLPILFRFEHWKDRIGKALRLNREFQTQDSTFDDKVYIESDCSDDVLQHLLSNENIRYSILALLETGYTEVVFFSVMGHDLVVEVSPPNIQLLEPTTFIHTASNMESLSQELPLFAPLSVQPRSSGLMGSIAFSLAILGVGLYYLFIRSWETLGFSLWFWAVPVLVGLIALNMFWSWLRFRNRSTGLRSFAGWMAFSTMILTIACYPITGIINAIPDTSNTKTTAKVKYTTYLKGSGRNKTPHCNLHLQLANQTEKHIVTIPCKTYRSYYKGQTIELTLHEGLLGVPWVDNLTPPKP